MAFPNLKFGKCPVCGGRGDDNSSPGSAFSTSTYPANVVSNGNFVDGVSSDWTLYNPDGAGVVREPTIVKGGYSAKINAGSSILAAYIYQSVHATLGITYWQGKTVTLYAWVWCGIADRATVYITDGVGSTASTGHRGNSNWELLKVTHIIDASATELTIRLKIAGWLVDHIAYFDGVALAENDALALAIQARILREAKAAIDSDVTIPTGTGAGYVLEYYQGRLMCAMCKKRLRNDEESRVAAVRYNENQRFWDKMGVKKTMD